MSNTANSKNCNPYWIVGSGRSGKQRTMVHKPRLLRITLGVSHKGRAIKVLQSSSVTDQGRAGCTQVVFTRFHVKLWANGNRTLNFVTRIHSSAMLTPCIKRELLLGFCKRACDDCPRVVQGRTIGMNMQLPSTRSGQVHKWSCRLCRSSTWHSSRPIIRHDIKHGITHG